MDSTGAWALSGYHGPLSVPSAASGPCSNLVWVAGTERGTRGSAPRGSAGGIQWGDLGSPSFLFHEMRINTSVPEAGRPKAGPCTQASKVGMKQWQPAARAGPGCSRGTHGPWGWGVHLESVWGGGDSRKRMTRGLGQAQGAASC